MFNSIEHWRIFLKGSPLFHVVTDCVSLLNLETLFSKTNPTLVRKLQKLAEYNFVIQHMSGKQNGTADFLSRYLHKRRQTDQSVQTESPEQRRVNVHKIDHVNDVLEPSIASGETELVEPIIPSHLYETDNTVVDVVNSNKLEFDPS